MIEEHRAARNFADRLREMRELTIVGCPPAQVNAVTSWLRDANDNYCKHWTEVGLQGRPRVRDYKFLRGKLVPEAIAIVGEADELVPSQEQLRAELETIGRSVPEGVIIMPRTALGWYVYNDPADRVDTNKNDPFRLSNQTVGQFFNDTPVYWQGLTISRWQIIQYAAYHLGHVHSEQTVWSASNPRIIEALDQVNHMEFGLPRNTINYLLLCFARTLSTSDSAAVFIQAALRTTP